MRGCGVEERLQSSAVQSCGSSTRQKQHSECRGVSWFCRAGSWGKEQSQSQSQAGLRGAAAVTRAGQSSHAPLDLHGCSFSPPGRSVGSWGVGGPTAPSVVSPSVLLHTGVLVLRPAKQTQTLHHSGIYRNRITLSGVGLMGVSTDCTSEHSCCWGTSCSGLKAHTVLTSAWVDQSQSCNRQGSTDSISTQAGTCQVLPFAARLGFIFSAKGKTTSRKNPKPSRAHAHWNMLRSQTESFFLGYSCFTESSYTSTAHHDFYIKSHKWS